MKHYKKNRIIVTIDTSSNKLVSISLKKGTDRFKKEEEMTREKAQVILPLLSKLLDEHKLSFSSIDELKVMEGPGSFTGLRVGVAVANMLSILLKVPLNGKPYGTLVEPIYQ